MFQRNKKTLLILTAMLLTSGVTAKSEEINDEFLLLGTYFKNFSSKADSYQKKNDDSEPDSNTDSDDESDVIPPEPAPEPISDPFPVVKQNNVVKAEKNMSGEILKYNVSDDINSLGQEALWMTDKNTFVYNNKILDSDSDYTVLVENEAYFENNGTIKGSNAGVKLSGISKMINNSVIENSGDIGVEVSEGSYFENNGIIKNGKNYGILVYGKNSEAINTKSGIIENGDINDKNTGLAGIYAGEGGTGRNMGIVKNTSYYGIYVTGAGSAGINESTGVISNGAAYGYGYFGMYADDSGMIINQGLIMNANCRGMYVKGIGTTAINEISGVIKNGSAEKPYVYDIGGMQAASGALAINKGRIETVGMYGMTSSQTGSHAVNEATGVIANTSLYGMYAESGGKATNYGEIKNDQDGMYVTGSGSTVINEATGVIANDGYYGIRAVTGGTAYNKGIIQNTLSFGMYANNKNSVIVNETDGIIQNSGNSGMAAANGGAAYNYGTIKNKGNYGMDINSTSTGVNNGIIHLTGNNKTGVNVLNSSFINNGTIILEGKNNIGIRAANSTITLTPNSVITLTDGITTDTVVYENTDFDSKGEKNTSTLGKFYSLDSKSTLVNSGSIVGKTININGESKFIMDSQTGKIQADNLVLETDMYINSQAMLNSSKSIYEINNLNVEKITGDGKIISDAELFTANTEKTDKGYKIVLTRKNFQDVYLGDLGKVLEDNYQGSESNRTRNKVYNALKQASNAEQLETAFDELTAAPLTGNQVYQQYTQNKMINNSLNTMLNKRDENISGTYVNVFGSNSNTNNYNNVKGYDSGTSGILLGRMEKITSKTAVGAFFGYVNAEYNYKDNGKSQQITDTWILSGAVEQKLTPNLKWTSVISYNTSDNDTERKLTYDNSNTTLTGNFRSWSAGGSSSLEYKQKINNYIDLKPTIGIILDYIEQSAYSEEGGTGVNADSYNGFSAKAAAGVRADFTAFQNNNHKFMIQPRILYTYEMGDPYDSKQITMTDFVGMIGIENRTAERNDLDLGVDLQYIYKDKLSFYAGYESGVLSDDRLQTITGGFKIMF